MFCKEQIAAGALLFLLSAELLFPQGNIFSTLDNFHRYKRPVRIEPAGLHPNIFFAHSALTVSNFFANLNGISQSHLRTVECLLFGMCLFGELFFAPGQAGMKKIRSVFAETPPVSWMTRRALENAEKVSCKKVVEISGLALWLLEARHDS